MRFKRSTASSPSKTAKKSKKNGVATLMDEMFSSDLSPTQDQTQRHRLPGLVLTANGPNP